jgi:hypothetical protein
LLTSVWERLRCPTLFGAARYATLAYYIDVRDVDQLYAELKPKLATLPTRDVYGPVNQPYGQRELLVLAPDGNPMDFGQAIETAKA